MKKLAPGLVAGTAALALCATVMQPAQATSSAHSAGGGSAHARTDNHRGLHHKQLLQQKQKALALLDAGKAKLVKQPGGGATVTLAGGDVVEFPVNKSDEIFTILAEFGDQGSGKLGTTPGPLHNQIPKPDRTLDNSTYWVQDFNQAHYDEMFNGDGESFKNYYEQLSSGRYTATNTVTDWVQVPGNASTYGDNSVEDLGGSWAFIGDSADAWYASQLGDMSPAEIDTYLSQFDKWDRYDFDGDDNFNEPDGYIDHFQAVHAGEGEEAGADPDAIWSHRWYVNQGDYGVTGPTVGGEQNLYGGTQIGDSKYFIGDYTVEPENGGLGVFAHEFGHDLGLPDYYDTNAGDNSSSFWTLMSSGSWLNNGGDAIGTTPGLMGPEEKMFLGWLKYSEVNAGESGNFLLGPSQNTYSGADQAIKVNLPDVTTVADYTVPPAGDHAWYSGRGDDLSNTLTRTVPGAGSRVVVKASTWFDIEEDYDYLYAEYSTNGGDNWTQLGALTGSGTKWSSKRWAYKSGGKDTQFRFRYATDGGVNEAGAFLDNISITSGKGYSFTDGAENGANGWDVDGWKVSTGTETASAPSYYLIENRQYVGYDSTLQVGPYQFSEGITRPNWVERFPFQDGMLVWYVNHTVADNNTSVHPGTGYALPVDARPDSLTYPDGSSPTNRREPFDATFGLDATDRVCLHKQVADKKAPNGYRTLEACAPSVAGIPLFDDSDPNAYWTSTNPTNSVKVAGEGVTAEVTGQDGHVLSVHVDYPAVG